MGKTSWETPPLKINRNHEILLQYVTLWSSNAESWSFYASSSWDCASEPLQTEWLCMDEFSSLGEAEYAQLNQEHRQLQDKNLTHVEQLRSTDESEKVLQNSNHVS